MKISLQNISKHYTIDKEIIKAVDNISCEFEPFEISAIVGYSGCGKTTLLKLIAQIEPLTAGKIDCGDAKIGISFQEPRLFPWLNAEENLRFSSKNIKKEQIDGILKILGLMDFRNAYPFQLSGGMAQRVSLGRVLLYNPDIILADEPFSFLDFRTKTALQEDILKIWRHFNKTIIFATHDLEEAIALAKDIYIMGAGKIIGKVSPNRERKLIKMLKFRKRILEYLI
ncbi:MAG: ATP-binding cassette domain-containing protein [Elusimicrobiota bacterium]|jgi:sulfonate transport system ATP-binding protein|nr:ATP-binding cassette domain-containing protein [Elusimicrobiota bacterium]